MCDKKLTKCDKTRTRVQMPSAPKFESVATTQEAIDTVEELFTRQLSAAATQAPEPNKPIRGDSDAREAFWLLLEPETQRRVFLNRCANTNFWPRIRSLVGSPPFSFLRPEDDDVLRPAGITIGRVHMANSDPFAPFSSNEIGRGHFSDFGGRSYRVVTDGARHDPGAAPVFSRVTSGKRVVLDAKLPKMPMKEKVGIIKASRQTPHLASALIFPRPGERVQLSLNELLGASETTIEVRAIQQRSRNSPVARVYALVV